MSTSPSSLSIVLFHLSWFLFQRLNLHKTSCLNPSVSIILSPSFFKYKTLFIGTKRYGRRSILSKSYLFKQTSNIFPEYFILNDEIKLNKTRYKMASPSPSPEAKTSQAPNYKSKLQGPLTSPPHLFNLRVWVKVSGQISNPESSWENTRSPKERP